MAPPPDSTQRPLAPPSVQLLSLEHSPGGPPPSEQSPGGGVVRHWASFGRWLVGTRPPSMPPDELPLEEPLLLLLPELVLLPELLLEPLPLELAPELVLDPPELDELPPSVLPPSGMSAVAPPHAHKADTTTTAPSFRCMPYLTSAAPTQLRCRRHREAFRVLRAGRSAPRPSPRSCSPRKPAP